MRAKLRHARLAVALLAALSLTSCSYMTDFVVLNKSGAPVVVEYTFKERLVGGPVCCPAGERPARKSVREVENEGDTAWTDLREDEFTYDAKAGRITVFVKPGDALRVMRDVNYGGHEQETAADAFDLKSIGLTGAKGSMHVEGRQAQTAFKEVSANLYTLTY